MDSYLNNPEFIEVATEMQSEEHEPRILVYVESENDILFWNNLLHYVQANKFIVTVFDYQICNCRNLLVDLLNQGKLNKSCLIAIDADIDIIFYDANNRLNLDHQYLIHTFSYSRENIQYTLENVQEYFQRVVLSYCPDFNLDEFNDLLKQYVDACLLSIKSLVNDYLHANNKLLPNATNDHFENTISVVRTGTILSCISDCPGTEVHERLEEYLGCIPRINEEAYRYIQGHKLEAHISMYEKHFIAQIKAQMKEKGMTNKIGQFDNFIKNHLGSLKSWIFNQFNYTDPVVLQIIAKIQSAIK